MSNVASYKVLVGTHHDDSPASLKLNNGKAQFNEGETIYSHFALDKVFSGKFGPSTVPAPAVVQADAEISKPNKEHQPQKRNTKFGRDRTLEFDEAEDAGLKVYADEDGAHTVVDPEAPDVALNDEPLKAGKVAPFIKKYLKK